MILFFVEVVFFSLQVAIMELTSLNEGNEVGDDLGMLWNYSFD